MKLDRTNTVTAASFLWEQEGFSPVRLVSGISSNFPFKTLVDVVYTLQFLQFLELREMHGTAGMWVRLLC